MTREQYLEVEGRMLRVLREIAHLPDLNEYVQGAWEHKATNPSMGQFLARLAATRLRDLQTEMKAYLRSHMGDAAALSNLTDGEVLECSEAVFLGPGAGPLERGATPGNLPAASPTAEAGREASGGPAAVLLFPERAGR